MTVLLKGEGKNDLKIFKEKVAINFENQYRKVIILMKSYSFTNWDIQFTYYIIEPCLNIHKIVWGNLYDITLIKSYSLIIGTGPNVKCFCNLFLHCKNVT
jgi:hypothetical protein